MLPPGGIVISRQEVAACSLPFQIRQSKRFEQQFPPAAGCLLQLGWRGWDRR